MAACWPATRLTAEPLAVHGGRIGPSRGSLLQPTASSDDNPASHRLLRIRCSLRDFPGQEQGAAEADRPRHLVDPNDRDDQGLERDPPFGEGPPRELREPQHDPRLRYKA